jgi:hypothetical protein
MRSKRMNLMSHTIKNIVSKYLLLSRNIKNLSLGIVFLGNCCKVCLCLYLMYVACASFTFCCAFAYPKVVVSIFFRNLHELHSS